MSDIDKNNIKNIFLIVLDSVRRDVFYSNMQNMCNEIQNDFVSFSNCNSIYTNTFNSHYAIFFGDYLFKSKYFDFPYQLQKIGFKIKSFCNSALFTNYPLEYENIVGQDSVIPFRKQIIDHLGLEPMFVWDKEFLGNNVEDYVGSADDEFRMIPDVWKNYIIENKDNANFVFLHFWKTHHNYGINDFFKDKITGQNYREIGKKLINKIKKREISIKFVKMVYEKRIIEVMNNHILALIKILKDKDLYHNSLIIITSDHGEGLGDIGSRLPPKILKIYALFFKIYNRIRRLLKTLPKIKKIPNRLQFNAFFHNGGYDFQKQVPFLIKFPSCSFGGLKINMDITLFDIIHTINDLIGNQLKIPINGCPLNYLLSEGKFARERYKLNRFIKTQFLNSNFSENAKKTN
ncbi:MAG: sulfatase-like hydrolase/transferase [Promethearchaeota archaeon]